MDLARKTYEEMPEDVAALAIFERYFSDDSITDDLEQYWERNATEHLKKWRKKRQKEIAQEGWEDNGSIA